MIIEIAIGVATIAAASGLVAVFRRRPPRPSPSVPTPGPRGPRGLRVRDVVTAPGLEIALAAMIELDEEGLVLRAFRTLEHDERWLVQLDREATRLALGHPTTEVPDGNVPEALPVGGRTVRIHKRGAANVRVVGEGIPKMARAQYAVLTERAGRTVVVIDPEGGVRLALRLESLDIRGVDVLFGGDVEPTS